MTFSTSTINTNAEVVKMRMAIRSAGMLILVILASGPTAAQSGVAAGPLFGLCKAQDADGYRIFGGAAMRFRLSDVFGIEGSINYGGEDYGKGTVEVRSLPVMITGLLYPIPGIYGAIGAGWYGVFVSSNVPPGLSGGLTTMSRYTRQQFGWHFGLGVELPVFSFIRLVGDIRYVYISNKFNSLPGKSVISSNSPLMTAGLLFDLW